MTVLEAEAVAMTVLEAEAEAIIVLEAEAVAMTVSEAVQQQVYGFSLTVFRLPGG